MYMQESAGDVPTDTAMDLVDASPPLQNPIDPNSEKAMKAQKENTGETSSTYSMTHPNRGFALIINNEKFHPKTNLDFRNGSVSDVIKLTKVLEEKLQFNVIIENDRTVNEMKKIFNDISKIDHTQNDCFLCVILSHGMDRESIYGTDDTVDFEDLISYILPDRCPTLSGKPKLFFVQACRGKKEDKGYDVPDCAGSVPRRPLWSDTLIVYSSVPGYVSVRNPNNGSWFIQSLCDMLEEHGNDLEILEIMTKVNFRVAEYEYQGNNVIKQIPNVNSMLIKKLIFSPKKTNSK